MKNGKFIKIGLTSIVTLAMLCFCVLVVPGFLNKEISNPSIVDIFAESQSINRGTGDGTITATSVNESTHKNPVMQNELIPQNPVIQNNIVQKTETSHVPSAYEDEAKQNTGILFDDEAVVFLLLLTQTHMEIMV